MIAVTIIGYRKIVECTTREIRDVRPVIGQLAKALCHHTIKTFVFPGISEWIVLSADNIDVDLMLGAKIQKVGQEFYIDVDSLFGELGQVF